MLKPEPWVPYIPETVLSLYEIHSYRSAAQILATSCKTEFAELMEALSSFRLTLDQIRKPGGNRSDIPKRISSLLSPYGGWMETRIKGDLVITKVTGKLKKKKLKDYEEEEDDNGGDKDSAPDAIEEIEKLKKSGAHVSEVKRENFLDGHKIDHIKNRVAFDVEWNSKDQTFDRDLYAFRAFHESDLIDAAVLLTRSASLNEVFAKLGAELNPDGTPKLTKKGKPKLLKHKYGASTTWMGKLTYRLNAGRHGGCPVLVLGITPKLIEDLRSL